MANDFEKLKDQEALTKLLKPSFTQRLISAGTRLGQRLQGVQPQEDTTVRDLLIKQELADLENERKLQEQLDKEEREFQTKVKLKEEEARIEREDAFGGLTPIEIAILQNSGVDVASIISGKGDEKPPTSPTAEDLSPQDITERLPIGQPEEIDRIVQQQRTNLGSGAILPDQPLGVTKAKIGDITLGETPAQQTERKLFEEGEKDIIERRGKIRSGQRAAISNLEVISGVGRDLSQVYVDGVREGGLGGIIQKGIGKAAETIGDIPIGAAGKRIEVGGRFPATGAFPGKRNEFMLKMMPMLTQQTEKPEGSVRLIRSILQALGRTLPTENTAPRTARRQLKETLMTFFRFARAAQNNEVLFDEQIGKVNIDNLTKEDKDGNIVITDPRLQSWIDIVADLESRIELLPEEQEIADKFVANAVEPIDTLLTGTPEGIRAEIADIDRQLAEE